MILPPINAALTDKIQFVQDIFPIKIPSNLVYNDISYWQLSGSKAAAQPYLPYFHSCELFGPKIYLFEIFENSNFCTMPRIEDINVVQAIPVTGITPNSDLCVISTSCRYLEDVTNENIGKGWWTYADRVKLYHITSEGQTPADFFSSNTTSSLQSYLDGVLSEAISLIPVEFNSQGDFDNAYPSIITMTILYNQMSTSQKKIVGANVLMSNYIAYNTSDPHPTYTLSITYRGMNFFELLNAFQFDFILYIIAFLIFDVVVVIGSFFLWLTNRVISRRKHPPRIRVKKTFSYVFLQMLIGSILGIIPIMLLVAYVSAVYSTSFISQSTSWDPANVSEEDMIAIKGGRLGLLLVISAIFMLYFGASLIIGKPGEEEELIIIKSYKKRLRHEEMNISSLSSNSSSSDHSIYENEEQEIREEIRDNENLQISKQLSRKKFHFLMIAFTSSVSFIYILELSYSNAFKDFLSLFIFLFILAEAMLSSVLERFYLKEVLLIAPIVEAFEIIQYVTILAANTFLDFIISLLIRLVILVTLRAYIDPVLKNMDYYLAFLLKFSSKRKVLSTLIPRILRLFIRPAKYNELFKSAFSESAEQYRLEPLLNILLSYTSNAHSAFTRPIVILIIRIFAIESKIATNYYIEVTDLSYYLLFTFVFILGQIFMDLFLLNSLELLHDFKLFDYFDYSHYRNKWRKSKWLPNNFNLDKIVGAEYRTFDNLGFSWQYYTITTVISLSCCLITLGMTIIIKQSYDPFADPAILGVIFLTGGVMGIGGIAFNLFMTYITPLLRSSNQDKEERALTSLDGFIKSSEIAIENLLEEDLIRKYFIVSNKSWILKNLKMFLKSENFEENERYLLNLYQMLKNEEKLASKELKRAHIFAKKKEKMEMLIRRTEENFEDDENILRLKKSLADNLKIITQFWLYRAKENNYLKSAVQSIKEENKDSFCRRCTIDVELNVVENIPFLQLLYEFRKKIAGIPFIIDHWVTFYKKKQRFTTLCYECEIMHKLKMKQKIANIFRKPEIVKIYADGDKKDEKDMTKIIVLKWLCNVRSSFLHCN